jgi:hypothetical protein
VLTLYWLCPGKTRVDGGEFNMKVAIRSLSLTHHDIHEPDDRNQSDIKLADKRLVSQLGPLLGQGDLDTYFFFGTSRLIRGDLLAAGIAHGSHRKLFVHR